MKKTLYFIISIFFILLFIACQKGIKQSENLNSEETKLSLRYTDNGLFKIAQFTDMHWDNSSSNTAKTISSIKYILETEKPDLAVLTGDIVTEAPAKESWDVVAKIFEETKTPWCIVLGNHDAEIDVNSRGDIFDLIASKPYFIGSKGPESIDGSGNYVLPILAHNSDTIKSLVYAIDTKNKPVDPKYGHYDYVNFNQVNWYRNESNIFTNKNQGDPIPSIAFIHIPLPEYKNIEPESIVGNKDEFISSSDINSGLFASFIDKGDVMAVFCGHDHNNDFIGKLNDIALGYGRRSGEDAYGELPIGARIINLYEGDTKFDTWISTESEGKQSSYYYPSGISSIDESSLTPLEATDIQPKENGVSYTYYEGKFANVSELSKAKSLKEGRLNNFSLSPAEVKDWMGFDFQTWINIPENGVYNFYTFSDDGSVLYIDGKVVDNDGSHSDRRRNGKVALEKGFHYLQVLYFERYMGEKLEVGFSSRNIKETLLPDSILFIK